MHINNLNLLLPYYYHTIPYHTTPAAPIVTPDVDNRQPERRKLRSSGGLDYRNVIIDIDIAGKRNITKRENTITTI